MSIEMTFSSRGNEEKKERMEQMTRIQRRFARAAYPEIRQWTLARRRYLQARVRQVAYHEAGHVVASAFTGLDFGHIVHVSIIPTERNRGHVRIGSRHSEAYLEGMQLGMKRAL